MESGKTAEQFGFWMMRVRKPFDGDKKTFWMRRIENLLMRVSNVFIKKHFG